ncbi:MAG: phytoene desaturase family protein, partial [Actinomycetota bacterium]
MGKRYDAVVIGGGHNGLTAAAYLARAGRSVLVLERRHVLGGAAVTEEIFPGFRFSEFSYVVSLLRPEIIRELELPKHGLEILPLDGTITPLDQDFLWRRNDHGETIRELRRWSRSDAEAYEEYGQLMAEMARFIKPILSTVPPDVGRINPWEWTDVLGLARTFRDLPQRLQATFVQLMTMSATEFLEQWFETDPLIATMSASGIIGTFQGVRSPGTAYVLLHHYMGEIDGAFRAWGIPRGGTGAISDSIGRSAFAACVEIRMEASFARIAVRYVR